MRTLVSLLVLLAAAGVANADDGGEPQDAGLATPLDAGALAEVDAGSALDAGPLDGGSIAPAPVSAAALPPEPALPAHLVALTSSTQLGGYAELTYNRLGDQAPIIDLRRFVLSVAHDFDAHLRVYTELEVEHAVTSGKDQGEVEVEQAYAEYLHRDWLNLRAGLVLMPVGIINQQHEPPTFHGVDRPLVDTAVIPSTWREPGVGAWGRVAEDFRYQVYLVDGMRGSGFTAGGIREGHQEGQLARARSGALVARVDFQPLNTLDVGLSGYAGSANQGELPEGAGRLTLGELDLRFDWRGLVLRGEVAALHVTRADLIPVEGRDGPPVGSTQYGLYAEVGYDVMPLLRCGCDWQLVVYVRYQRVDTQAHVEGPLRPDDAAEVQIFEGGVTFRPIPELALKGDVRRISHPIVSGADLTALDLGLGWMF
jgi:hypothetical protein